MAEVETELLGGLAAIPRAAEFYAANKTGCPHFGRMRTTHETARDCVTILLSDQSIEYHAA
jgi:hypothetical protein